MGNNEVQKYLLLKNGIMNILFLGRFDPVHIYLINEIDRYIPLSAVVFVGLKPSPWVIPPKIPYVRQLLNLIPTLISKKKSRRRFFDIMMECLFPSGLGSSLHRQDRFRIFDEYLGPAWQKILRPDLGCHHFNDGEVNLELIRSLKPDVIINMTLPYLNEKLTSLVPVTILNIHFGLLPYMSGENCVSFAIIEKNINNIGITISMAEKDTYDDPILLHAKPELSPEDSPFSIELKMTKLAAEQLLLILKILEKGEGFEVFPQNKACGKEYHKKYWNKSMQQKLGFVLNRGKLGKYANKKYRDDLPVCVLTPLDNKSEKQFVRKNRFPFDYSK